MNAMTRIREGASGAGSLVCSVITANKIYLFSDGRVHTQGEIVSDNHTKVHEVAKFTGMLAAGMYLKPLVPTVTDECKVRKLVYVEDVVQVTALVLRKTWEDNRALMERLEKEEKMKIFALVAGFSKSKEPKLYYVDSNSNPRFAVVHRPLFTGGRDVEIAAIVSTEATHDATTLMVKHIHRIRRTSKSKKLGKIFRRAFDATKREISAENRLVGGSTFVGTIDPVVGFRHDTS